MSSHTGFLSTEDNVLPGNIGLRDQTEALRWVKKNIHKFGGDSSRVTLFGHTSGACSVHLQVLSPHAKGLFQRAILQSGTALCPWCVGESHRATAFKLGRLLNCSAGHDSTKLVACLKKKPYGDIIENAVKLLEWFILPQMAIPRVDGDFLLDHPAKLLRSGNFNHVDVISGITKDEGLFSTLTLYTIYKSALKTLNDNMIRVGNLTLHVTEEESPEYLVGLALFRYLPNLNVSNIEDVKALSKLVTDRDFKSGHWDTILYHTGTTKKVYEYVFEHRGQHSLLQKINNEFASTNHVSHGEDLLYLFDGVLSPAKLTKPMDIFVRNVITQLWANFAATGNPTINGTLGFRWTRKTDHLCNFSSYLNISTTPGMKTETTSDKETRMFWRHFPTKNNKILYPYFFQPEPRIC
ncbi:hypothetical protein Pcinc_010291 [Petrolisthes cinctipes]|uniref:Carboxylesterase type B domain-containing protein n=1 Tax=Petrolisthes cinctipes TaxID=88211 RepID=A0AAE1KXL2_PETCI|nr:hypothetical protein Pcinc_010291 [Petrolisthes cinctipes]